MLRLEVVQVLGQLAVDVVGQDAHRGEEGAQDGELLLQQLHLLLQPLVLPRQDLDSVLGLAGPHLRLLARLAHRDVVPLPAAAVLVRTLLVGILVLLAGAEGVLWLLGEGLERGQRAAEAEGEHGGGGHLLGGVVGGAGHRVVAVVVVVVIVVVGAGGGAGGRLGAGVAELLVHRLLLHLDTAHSQHGQVGLIQLSTKNVRECSLTPLMSIFTCGWWLWWCC